MQPFRIHTGNVAPLEQANIDTDQIIPKQFLKRVERTGYGQFLFYDWRFTPDGAPLSEFVLNQARFAGASILAAGRNFGCGSSREHAAWALLDFGIRAVIAPSFADIFATNATKNGIVTVALPEEVVREIARRASAIDRYQLTIDLENLVVTDGRLTAKFEMDDFRRKCLLEGLDEIGMTLRYEGCITAYEARRKSGIPSPTAC